VAARYTADVAAGPDKRRFMAQSGCGITKDNDLHGKEAPFFGAASLRNVPESLVPQGLYDGIETTWLIKP
jgi:hypothetical protein